MQRLVGLGYKLRTAPPPPDTPDPPPVKDAAIRLPGGGILRAEFATKLITYPPDWTGQPRSG